MPRTKKTDTPDPTDPADLAEDTEETREDFHAHLGPVEAPKFEAATDDPDHPLHHHGKQ